MTIEIVDFPIKTGDFRYVSLPEGSSNFTMVYGINNYSYWGL
jgi:hypothetical protein